jgi:hypothetical protein
MIAKCRMGGVFRKKIKGVAKCLLDFKGCGLALFVKQGREVNA